MPKVVVGTEVPHVHAPKSSAQRFDEAGRFIPDGRPMEPPLGFKRAPSLSEQIREMVRSEQLQRELAASGVETFEEANDFYIDDEPDSHPMSGYENDEDTPLERLLAARAAAEAGQGGSGEGGTPEGVEARPEPGPAGGAGPKRSEGQPAGAAKAADGP